jgi:hypothetical protein
VITGIDHVQVAAPPGCEPAARSFYGGLLELAEVDKPPALAARGGCWFAVGGQQLHVGVAQPLSRPPRPIRPCARAIGLRWRRWRRGCRRRGTRCSGTT